MGTCGDVFTAEWVQAPPPGTNEEIAVFPLAAVIVAFAKYVIWDRARFNLTQDDLARKVGVRRETILFIEKGEYNPSLKN